MGVDPLQTYFFGHMTTPTPSDAKSRSRPPFLLSEALTFLECFISDREAKRNYYIAVSVVRITATHVDFVFHVDPEQRMFVFEHHEASFVRLAVSSFAEFSLYFRKENDRVAFPRVIACTPETVESTTVLLGEQCYTPPTDCRVDMQVDAMDCDGIWYEAVVRQVGKKRVLVHYCGWDERWDTWMSLSSWRLAPFRTFTRPWKETLGLGDRLEVRHRNKWYTAVLRAKHGSTWTVEVENDAVLKNMDSDQERDDMNPLGVHTRFPYRKKMHVTRLFPVPLHVPVRRPLYLHILHSPRAYFLSTNPVLGKRPRTLC